MPRNKIDLTGSEFGMLVVLRFHETRRFPSGGSTPYWWCKCACGREVSLPSQGLRKGISTSCGCQKGELISAKKTRHGQCRTGKRTREHTTWSSMIARCTDRSDKRYVDYGGRGIKVCERWFVFENFFADMGVSPSPKHTVERIDTNGNYDPLNCRWATRKEQSLNRRSNRLVQYNGERKPVAAWVAQLGLNEELVRSRLRLGWSFQDAVDTPPRNQPRR